MTTYAELQKKIAQLQEEAEQVRKSELAQVINDIKSKIAEFGLTAADLGLGSSGKKTASRKAVAAKYRDPASGNTWSGRGRAPVWLVEAEKAGKKRDSFLIA